MMTTNKRNVDDRARDQGVRTRGQGRREWSNRDPQSNKPTSTDPEFTAKTRGIFRLIKATHHLGTSRREHPPASIAKMADQLMAAIKPLPQTSTMTLIEVAGEDGQHGQNTRYPTAQTGGTEADGINPDHDGRMNPRLRYRRYPGSRGEVKVKESTSGIREPQQGEPTLQTIDEDPGKLQQIRKGRLSSGGDDPRYQGTLSVGSGI
ncbi:hypothetical protein DPEC_G00134560 [Dallia pectoralis]|uniref:Uncharacterized protein n=1 Tax=Dallia pectoralis TaxID=75939 RepID=A0ACC2GRK7_DALPE|nr:hypothetical protein DPEC_G00134560 [Dallia pectoralis]